MMLGSIARITGFLFALILTGCAQMGGELKAVAVSGGAKAAGPYSRHVIANGFLFTAGFTPQRSSDQCGRSGRYHRSD